ncbi:MAG: hypothetical protein K2M31_06415 [Muribaculaceae bacterium]|nr:hypothetical protein [Muribaculaceae bacterium]
MMHFVESVTLYSVNTAKARPIQAAAAQFEHTLLEPSALMAMISDLKKLVKYCNSRYRGSDLEFHHTSGHITVRYPASGTEKLVVSISYAPVLCHIKSDAQAHEEIARILRQKFPQDACCLDDPEEGGEA